MRWSHLFSISRSVLGELPWGANKWDGFMGNCCHSRCWCKTNVSSPIRSRMITPMLGAHSIECVNFIHCNLNNQFCQQETHKQLSMDFLSMDYIVDELLVDELHCWWNSCRWSGVEDFLKISRRFLIDFSKIFWRFLKDFFKISQTFLKDFSKFFWKFSEDFLKIFQRFLKDFPKISWRFPKDF